MYQFKQIVMLNIEVIYCHRVLNVLLNFFNTFCSLQCFGGQLYSRISNILFDCEFYMLWMCGTKIIAEQHLLRLGEGIKLHLK